MSFPRRTGVYCCACNIQNLSLQIQSPGIKKEKSSSGGKTPGVTSLSGSVTVEAALALTLVLFAWTTLLTLFSVMHIHMELRYAMEQTAEEYAVFAHLTEIEVVGEAIEKAMGGSELIPLAMGGITNTALRSRIIDIMGRERLEQSCILGGCQGITLLGDSGLTEEGDIRISLTYLVKLPFIPGPFSLMLMTQQVIRHAWVGDVDGVGKGGDGEYSGEKVFVTPHGTVYHKSDSCTHLKLSVKSVSIGVLENLRSEDGSKYYPCERCASSGGSGHVYITSEGNRYHMDTNCGSLKRTVETVEKSEISLPACEKCSSGE